MMRYYFTVGFTMLIACLVVTIAETLDFLRPASAGHTSSHTAPHYIVEGYTVKSVEDGITIKVCSEDKFKDTTTLAINLWNSLSHFQHEMFSEVKSLSECPTHDANGKLILPFDDIAHVRIITGQCPKPSGCALMSPNGDNQKYDGEALIHITSEASSSTLPHYLHLLIAHELGHAIGLDDYYCGAVATDIRVAISGYSRKMFKSSAPTLMDTAGLARCLVTLKRDSRGHVVGDNNMNWLWETDETWEYVPPVLTDIDLRDVAAMYPIPPTPTTTPTSSTGGQPGGGVTITPTEEPTDTSTTTTATEEPTDTSTTTTATKEPTDTSTTTTATEEPTDTSTTTTATEEPTDTSTTPTPTATPTTTATPTATPTAAPTDTPTVPPVTETPVRYCTLLVLVGSGSGIVGGTTTVKCGDSVAASAVASRGWCFSGWTPSFGVSGATACPRTNIARLQLTINLTMRASFTRAPTPPPPIFRPTGTGEEGTPTPTPTPTATATAALTPTATPTATPTPPASATSTPAATATPSGPSGQ